MSLHDSRKLYIDDEGVVAAYVELQRLKGRRSPSSRLTKEAKDYVHKWLRPRLSVLALNLRFQIRHIKRATGGRP